jgi:hypothetical protein
MNVENLMISTPSPVAPKLTVGTTGAISVTIGSDATAMLFPSMADVGSKLTTAKLGSVLTVTPLAGQLENTAQSVTVKATDASGNRLATSTASSFSLVSVITADNAPVFAFPRWRRRVLRTRF